MCECGVCECGVCEVKGVRKLEGSIVTELHLKSVSFSPPRTSMLPGSSWRQGRKNMRSSSWVNYEGKEPTTGEKFDLCLARSTLAFGCVQKMSS